MSESNLKLEVLFFKPQSMYGKLIRFFKKQIYSHNGFNYQGQYSDSSFPQGVRVMDRREDYDYRLIYNITKEQHAKMVEYISIRKDNKYDLLDILYFINPKIKGFSNKYICTEYVGNLLNELGLENIKNTVLLPDDMLKLLKNDKLYQKQ